MAKKRRSLQSIFIPPFFHPATASNSRTTSPTSTHSTSPSLFNAAPASADGTFTQRFRSHSAAASTSHFVLPPAIPITISPTGSVSNASTRSRKRGESVSMRNSPPASDLLDDDPFADLSPTPSTFVPPEVSRASLNLPLTTSRSASLLDASTSGIATPRSPLAQSFTEDRASQLYARDAPSIFEASSSADLETPWSSPPRTPPSTPTPPRVVSPAHVQRRPRSSGQGQVRPAYTRPAFAPRPSLPSLHTLARMNVMAPRLKRGRVGAKLPAEPWALEGEGAGAERNEKRPAVGSELLAHDQATHDQTDMEAAEPDPDADPDFDQDLENTDDEEAESDSRRASLITIKGLRSVCANMTSDLEAADTIDGEWAVQAAGDIVEPELGREGDGVGAGAVRTRVGMELFTDMGSAAGADEVVLASTADKTASSSSTDDDDTICAPQLSRTHSDPASDSSCSSSESTSTSTSASSNASATTSTPSLSHTADSSESELESPSLSTQPSSDDLSLLKRAVSVYGENLNLHLDYDYLSAVSRLGSSRTPSPSPQPHPHLSPVSPKAAHQDFSSTELGLQSLDDTEAEAEGGIGAQTPGTSTGYHSGESTPPHEYGYGYGYGYTSVFGLSGHARSASNTSLWTFNMVESPLSPRSPQSPGEPRSPGEPQASSEESSDVEEGEGEREGEEEEQEQGEFYSVANSSHSHSDSQSHESFYSSMDMDAGMSRVVSYAEAVYHDDGASETGDDDGEGDGDGEMGEGDVTARLSVSKRESKLDLSEESSVYQTAEEEGVVDAGEGGGGQQRAGGGGGYGAYGHGNGNGNGSARYAGNGNGNGNGGGSVGWPSARGGMRSGGGRDDDDDDGRDRRPRGNGTGNAEPPSKVYVGTSDSESEDDDGAPRGRPSRGTRRANNSSPPPDTPSTDDDVPLAQRLPTALKAQKSIRAQVRAEHEQRKRARSLRRPDGRDPSSSDASKVVPALPSASARSRQPSSPDPPVQRQQPLMPAPVPLSAPVQVLAPPGNTKPIPRRPRTNTMPSKVSSPFSIGELTKKLLDVQHAIPPLPLSARPHVQEQTQPAPTSVSAAKESMRMQMDTPAPAPAPAPPAASSGPFSGSRVLRPMRSFHRPRTAQEPEIAPPVPIHANTRLGRSATTAVRRHPPSSSDEPTSPPMPVQPLGGMSISSARTHSRRPSAEPVHLQMTAFPSEGATGLERKRSGRSSSRHPSVDAGRTGRVSNDNASRPPVPPLPSGGGEPKSTFASASATARGAAPAAPTWHQRIFIGNTQRFAQVEMAESYTARDVLGLLHSQDELGGSATGWMLWERCQDFGLERPVRSFETVSKVCESWVTGKTVNLLIAMKTPLAMKLSRAALPSSSPVFSGWVQHEYKKGKWQKRWMELREHSLWLSKRETGKDQVMLCSMNTFDAYVVIDPPGKAPKGYVFAVKSTDNIAFFESTADYVHLFSVPGKDGATWLEKILLARSYVIHQEHKVITGNSASAAGGAGIGASLSRAGTRRRPAQPLVSFGGSTIPTEPPPPTAPVFEPGSLLAKRAY